MGVTFGGYYDRRRHISERGINQCPMTKGAYNGFGPGRVAVQILMGQGAATCRH